MEAQSANALRLATWLERQPQVARVFYPGASKSHPQHALALRQQAAAAIVSVEITGGARLPPGRLSITAR